MILIVGLGNPGKKYSHTRHNIGFQILGDFREKNNFSAFRISKKFQAEISENKIANKKIVLAKPQTFMNESGKAVKALVNFYKTAPENLWIIHDDIDIPLGKIRISKGRTSAGHKGVQSTINELKTKNFTRIRIGISPKNGKPKNTERFVLQKFTKEEESALKGAVGKTTEAIEFALKNGLEKSMNEYNC
jgi:PTH1 family peptidyl-tRNA hydrolase